MITISVQNEQQLLTVDVDRLSAGVNAVLVGEGIVTAEVSLVVVDDPRIREINRQFLQHDYATDVISFVLEEGEASLEGEIVVSAEMAMAMSPQYAWQPADELLLYAIHGALHLVGYDDLDPDSLAQMRDRERHYLAQFGLRPHYDAPA